MKGKIYSLFAFALTAMLLSGLVFAQSERNSSAVSEMYVISAKAGGVNYVEGKVAVSKNNSRTGYLIKGDKLDIGDRVSTGTNGRAEILLNPGSYIRLGANTEFEFASTSLDDLKIKLPKGSAVFELIAGDEFAVSIQTPKGDFKVIESGIYRVEVLNEGIAKIFVYNGKVEIVDRNATIVKKGRTATVNGNNVAVEKFDRDEKGELDNWSKDRAKELAKINSKLQRNDIRNSLMNSYNRQGWGLYDSFGLWVFDRFSSQYCFLPFGYGWGSPYGYAYGRDLWYFRMPRYVYAYPTIRTPVGTTRSTNPNPPAANIERARRNSLPPFQRVNQGSNRQADPEPSTVFTSPRRTGPPLAPMSVPETKGKSDN